MRRAPVLLALTLGATLFPVSGRAEERAALPSPECVTGIRAARIAAMRKDDAGARRLLEGAASLPGCELPALGALAGEIGSGAVPAAERVALRERLAAKIADPAVPLPAGLVKQLSWTMPTSGPDYVTGHAAERAFAATLTRRLEAATATGKSVSDAERVELLETLADLHERAGEIEAEREALAKLLALAPSDRQRWRTLPLDAVLGRWDEVLATARRLAPTADAPEVLLRTEVRALAHLGRFDEMARALDRVEVPPPPAPPATGGAGAAGELADVVSIAPSDIGVSGYAELLLDSAWALRDAGRDADAATLFRRLLAWDPRQAEAQAALLHLYGTAEERAAVAAAVEERRSTETDPQKLFEEGSDLLAAGDAAKALPLLERAAPALATSGYAEAAWNNLATAAFKLERWSVAAEAFDQVVRLNPERVEARYRAGIALFHLDRCAESVERMRAVLARAGERKDAHYYLGGCLEKLGDRAGAAREKALFAAP